jgi:hypothetical protein
VVEIEDMITDGDTDVRLRLRRGREHAVGKVLDREI